VLFGADSAWTPLDKPPGQFRQRRQPARRNPPLDTQTKNESGASPVAGAFMGFLFWGLAILFLGLENPIGPKPDFFELFSFFIPVLSLIVPIALLDSSNENSLMWAIVFAPLLGLISMLLVTFVILKIPFISSMLSPFSEGVQASIVTFIFYLPIVLFVFINADKTDWAP
jgi:hypothetical protein